MEREEVRCMTATVLDAVGVDEGDVSTFELDVQVTPDAPGYSARRCATDDGCATTCASSCVSS
jgi:FxLD family lantipeptide